MSEICVRYGGILFVLILEEEEQGVSGAEIRGLVRHSGDVALVGSVLSCCLSLKIYHARAFTNKYKI